MHNFHRAALFALPIVILATSVLGAPLRVALPPDMGSVPVILAYEWGLFDAMGLDVEIIPLSSQDDRLRAFDAGDLDALVTDLTGVFLLNDRRPGYGVVTSTSYLPSEDNDTHVLLLAMPFANVASLEDIVRRATRGQIRVMVPPQSDLEYMLDTLFERHGFLPPRAAYLGQDDLVRNSQILRWGQDKAGAAVFPQPYADYISNLVAPGLPTPFVLTGFGGVPVPPTVLVFARPIVEGAPERVALFYEAVEQAIYEVNHLPEDELRPLAWQLAADLFLPGQDPDSLTDDQRAMVTAALEAVVIPQFPRPDPLDPAIFDDVLDWARARGYVFREATFEQLVVTVPTR